MIGLSLSLGLGIGSGGGAAVDPDGPQVAAYNQTAYLAIQSPTKMYPLSDADGSSVTFAPQSGSPTLSQFAPGVAFLPGVYPLLNTTQTSTFISRSGRPVTGAGFDSNAQMNGATAFNQIITICHFASDDDDGDSSIFDFFAGCRAGSSPFPGYGIGKVVVSGNQYAAFLLQSSSDITHRVLVRGSQPLKRNKAYNIGVRYSGNKLASGVQLYVESGGVITTETMVVISDTLGTDSISGGTDWLIGGLPGGQTVHNTESPDVAAQAYCFYNGSMTDARMKQLLAARPARVQRVRNEKATPERLLIDIDYAYDIDDATAIEMAIAGHKRGACIIAGVNVSGPNGATAPAVNAFLKSRGINVPLSCYKGSGRDGSAQTQIAVVSQFSLIKTRSDFLDPATNMLAVLASSPDNSVTVVELGPMQDLAAALAANPSLFAQKCKKLILQGGKHDGGGPSYNFSQSPADAAYVINNFPAPIFVDGDELVTGIAVAVAGNPRLHPTRCAFDNFGSTRGSAYDCIAMYYAIYPETSLIGTDLTNGTFAIDPSTGTNTWSATAGNANRLSVPSASPLLGAMESLAGCAAMELAGHWTE